MLILLFSIKTTYNIVILFNTIEHKNVKKNFNMLRLQNNQDLNIENKYRFKNNIGNNKFY